jgi:N-methylhydantoinase A
VVGAFEVARQAGLDQVITFDMGGTSTDVSLCPGEIQQTSEGTIAGLPLRLPIIDIHTVGAGGGSIASLDAGGALRVGPLSAGADPGPACYGHPQALHATVTDANLLLGRLDADHFLGGQMQLDIRRSQEFMADLSHRLNLPLETTAWGVIRVANSNMERAIRTISIERGHDPRLFTLVAFGGAGPLHACELASSLRIPRVLIPPQPGVLSALGMILADLVTDYTHTVMIPVDNTAPAAIERLLRPLGERAQNDLRAEGLADRDIALFPALDMRYVGQSYELTLPLPDSQARTSKASRSLTSPSRFDLAQAFHAAHRLRFSYANESEPIEIVNLRLKAVGCTAKPVFARRPLAGSDPRAAHLGYKQVYFSDTEPPHGLRPLPTALYERERLAGGNVVIGPAVLFQLDCTTVIPPGWTASVDELGNLLVRWDTTAMQPQVPL